MDPQGGRIMAATAERFPAPERVTSLAEVGFDEESWGVGVSGVVADPSPFLRINRLLLVVATGFGVDCTALV